MWRFVKYSCFTLTISIIFGCAHPGMPGGGAKDMSPPEVLKTNPENGSANFSSKKIIITFDEFIELDNITQKALISPPMDKLPDFKLKGKSLQIKFNEELKDSTTYSIYFADAIVDLTEGNPLLNYTYIFSTGSKVDSLSIFGKTFNAFDLQPPEDVFVVLYKNNNDTLPLDSLPINVIPYYVSKTTVNGEFQLNGLGDDEYLMFALKDLNANYIYDQPGEDIAFLDSLIKPFYVQPINIDSLRTDSTLFVVSDTLDEEEAEMIRDSLIHDYLHEYEAGFPHIELSMFNEVDSTQRLLKAQAVRKNTIQFSFAWPAHNVELIPLNFSADTTWYVEEVSKNSDTLTWYVKTLAIDTLEILALHQQDTLDHLFIKLDPKRKKMGLSKRQQKKDDKKKEYLGSETNVKGGILLLSQQPGIDFFHPVKSFSNDSILLVVDEDSTYSPQFVFIDSLKRKIRFPVILEEETRYLINIPDSSFIDWNGYHNAKIQARFRTKSLRDYGVFVLDIKPAVTQPYIFQLLNEKENVLKEYYFSSDTTITIEHLEPATYLLKLIFDNNGNKKWDSGNYNFQIQPEKVIYNPKKIQARANWDVEEEWIIGIRN